MKSNNTSLFQKALLKEALKHSFIKLNPKKLFRNPVMFTVWVGTVIMLFVCLSNLFGSTAQDNLTYNIVVFIILLLTLLFANFAEAIAEARGKSQADNLRKTREETPAKLLDDRGGWTIVQSSSLNKGQMFFCEAGDIIPADGEIIEGLATIDESAITGESAPVIRES